MERQIDLKLIDSKKLAEIIGVSTQTIRRWRSEGKLPRPMLQSGNKTFWSRFQIEDWQRVENTFDQKQT